MFEGKPEQLTDGYHTMAELYDHRRALSAVLAVVSAIDGQSFRSKQHHPDDDAMFDGYFIVGIETPSGLITYHYRLEHWDDFASVPELDHAPKWDGATSEDTVARLFEMVGQLAAAVAVSHLYETQNGVSLLEATAEAVGVLVRPSVPVADGEH